MQVHVTKDYSKFNIVEGNRQVNELHVKRLAKSMEEQYLISPIIVNEHFDVIDGQHRLQCAAMLNLPVYYVVCQGYGLTEIHRYNSNLKNWSVTDFMEGYIELGHTDYAKYKTFKERYGFGHAESMSLLMGLNADGFGGSSHKTFQSGGFKVKSYTKACEIADKITMVAPYYIGYRRRSFVMAMHQILLNKEFDIDTFLQKLKFQSTKLVDCVDTKAYLKLIEEIYNYKSRKIISLR